MAKGGIIRKLILGLLFAVHGFFLVGLTFFLMSTDFMHGDESWIIQNTAVTLRTLLPEPDKPDFDDFAFINVSKDLALIDRQDEFGFPAGNQVITDREKLTRLFRQMNLEPNWKLLFCDIFFADPSPADSALGLELRKLPNALFSYHLHDSGGPHLPVFDGIELGLADYYTLDDEFLKFRLQRSGIKSVPLRMYEMLDGGSFEEGTWSWLLNGKPAFNDFVLNFRIRQFDIFRDTLGYPSANLHDLMDLEKFGMGEQINAFTKDRIVVVGDFDQYDMHPTMFGDMAGPLILTNLYLALKHGDNRIPIMFPLFWWLLYSVLSYIVFTHTDFFESWVRRRVGSNEFILLLAQGISFLIILGGFSILSFVLFNYHINFLLITLYFNALEWILKIVRSRRKKAREAATTNATES